ncbi:MAG: HD domain-containing protein [Desulfonatronovibrionaceae bacterium]
MSTGNTDWKRLVDFFFEVGMLKKTPRTGYQFLGSGRENVAEHSYRTTVIGLVLAELNGADKYKVVVMCLFHDMHEARTGDFNYVNRLYNTSDKNRALEDALTGTGIQEEVRGFFTELEKAESLESRLAQDADQLDFILELKEQLETGNPFAAKWLDCAGKRLRTESGRRLARQILDTDPSDWWFSLADYSWWTRGNGRE